MKPVLREGLNPLPYVQLGMMVVPVLQMDSSEPCEVVAISTSFPGASVRVTLAWHDARVTQPAEVIKTHWKLAQDFDPNASPEGYETVLDEPSDLDAFAGAVRGSPNRTRRP